MYKNTFLLVTCLVIFLFFSTSAHAKLLPQVKSSNQTSRSTGRGNVSIYPRLRRDKLALDITFGNVLNTNSISYTLVYETNGQQEGAEGTVTPAEGNSASRELLFGTCSKNDCRYHSNIKNMKLEVTIETKSGKRTLKRYRIKV